MSRKEEDLVGFSYSELYPATGLSQPRTDSKVLAQLATMKTKFNEIYISNPSHNRFLASAEELRLQGLASKGERQMALRNLAPTGSGKTTLLKRYVRQINDKYGGNADVQPAIIVPLSHSSNLKQFWNTVLETFGDPNDNDRINTDTLKRRAYRCIERKKTQVIAVDEFQHLASGGGFRGDVTDALKQILDDGICTLIFCGTEDARKLMTANKQLTNRLMPPADILPLKSDNEQDRADFTQFVRRLDKAMLEKGLTKRLSSLDELRIASCLMEVSEGILGRVINLIRVAYSLSYRRDADFVEVCDLSTATATWAVLQKMVPHNPFTQRNIPFKRAK